MSAEAVRTNRRRTVVIAVSVAVSLVCIGWWAVQLQWFAQEPDVAEHVVGFEPQLVTLGDGAHARVEVAVVVVGAAGVEPVAAAAPRLRIALTELGPGYTAERLRTGEGQDALRDDLLRRLQPAVPEATLRRVLLTSVMVR